ncbi:hypothetical protein DERP_012576 [Dermatophagoides pteronyssinus]|uniref:Uncharacterized protein n=1 Tax=Dermatophagoides pteronyssinus TaxID=6956 RepID=A0ABQ8IUW1_DERPT|nr:hypothetical protein DERP_012576 [Dermatophagoides pteronyssinus]
MSADANRRQYYLIQKNSSTVKSGKPRLRLFVDKLDLHSNIHYAIYLYHMIQKPMEIVRQFHDLPSTL